MISLFIIVLISLTAASTTAVLHKSEGIQDWTLVKVVPKRESPITKEVKAAPLTFKAPLSDITAHFNRTSPTAFLVQVTIGNSTTNNVKVTFDMETPVDTADVVVTGLSTSPALSSITDPAVHAVTEYIAEFFEGASQWISSANQNVVQLVFIGKTEEFWFAAVPQEVDDELSCDTFVSKVAVKNNQDCNFYCQQLDKENLENFCIQERYEVADNQVTPTGSFQVADWEFSKVGQCYSNLVPGFSDESFTDDADEDLPLVAGDLMGAAASPSYCQLLCQLEPTCDYFSWRDIVNEGTDTQFFGACLLKTAEMVHEAQVLDVTGTAESKFCPTALKSLCATDPSRCLTCDGKTSCVLKMTSILSGPKYCTGNTDFCKA